MIFYGVYPAPVFDATVASVEALVNNITVSLEGRQDGGGELTRLPMTLDLASSRSPASPELIVAAGALVLLMLGVYRGEGRQPPRCLAGGAGLAAAGLVVIWTGGEGDAFGNAFVSDPFARFMKVLTLIGSTVTLIMSREFAEQEQFDKFEYPVWCRWRRLA